jgi:hypothetical protein
MDNVRFYLINFNQKKIIHYQFALHVQLRRHHHPMFSMIEHENLHFKHLVDYQRIHR